MTKSNERSDFEQVMALLTDSEVTAILQEVRRTAGDDRERAVKILRALARKQYSFSLVENFLRLVDECGQCIPHCGVTDKIVVSEPRLSFRRPARFDFAQTLENQRMFFPPGTEFLSPDEFQSQIVVLLETLRGDLSVGNLLNGVHLPVCFPKMKIGDYASTIRIFLHAVANAHSHTYSGMKFLNLLEKELETNFRLFESERFEKFLQTMAIKSQAGLFFPDSLRGFSPSASHQQIDAFPEGFSLAGVLGTALALVAHSEILISDDAPSLDCAAHFVQSDDDGRILFFELCVTRLYFGGRAPAASGSTSCGILYRGTI